MIITEVGIKQMLFDDTIVTVFPFMHHIVEEVKSRKSYKKGQPGCQSCKGPLYLDDLVAKSVSMFFSLNEDNKQKLRKFLNSPEGVFFVKKQNGTVNKIQIA